MNPDRIEKTVTLRAPIRRVWEAIGDATAFGAWFGAAFDGPFVAGATLTGRIRPTTVDPEVARLQAPHEGKAFEIAVEAVEPLRRLAFRWHPFAIDPAVDYSREPPTRVELELEEADGGTRLRITESGFDRIPPERRAAAYAANDGGWEHQARLVARYVHGREG
jgi:uncharacterized protein YndB with AHSA1/START domain